MAPSFLDCPACGAQLPIYRNPLPTVDIIIELAGGIVLIERKNEPFGWALPGGFVDYGEKLEDAARREALEETGLQVDGLRLLGCYSDPRRDPRKHTITAVYIAGSAAGTPAAGDDAGSLALFPPDSLPQNLCFDHNDILQDYLKSPLRSPSSPQ